MNDTRLPLHVRILQQELDERKAKNPRYSMRALARDLEIDPAALSRILSGKQDISLDTCRLIITKVGLPPVKSRLFIASVAEDKRNRAQLALTRALDPRHLVETTMDRRSETIMELGHEKPLKAYDSVAIEKDCISVIDLEGRFLYANEAMAKSWKRIPCELIGEMWSAKSLGADDEMLKQQLREATAAGREMSFEFASETKEKYYRHMLSPVLDADGQLTAFVSTIRDVTQNRFLLRASKEIHSSVVRDEVLTRAAKVAPPVLGEACVLRTKTALAVAHVAGDETSFVAKVRAPVDHFASEPARIEPLSSALSEALAFKGRTPVNALICPLPEHGSAIFLSERPYSDLDLKIAEEFVEHLSQSLRNADACSMRS